MSENHDPLTATRGDLDLLIRDLSCVRGTLEEVATMWRRAGLRGPELPLDLPMKLRDAAGQLASTLAALADAGIDQPPRLALSAAAQLAALEDDVAFAAAKADVAGAGDARLWQFLSQALHRVRERLPSLILHAVKINHWSLSKQARPGEPGPDRTRLLVELG